MFTIVYDMMITEKHTNKDRTNLEGNNPTSCQFDRKVTNWNNDGLASLVNKPPFWLRQ